MPKVAAWRLEWDSNPRPFGRKATNLPMSHHAPRLQFTSWGTDMWSQSSIFFSNVVALYRNASQRTTDRWFLCKGVSSFNARWPSFLFTIEQRPLFLRSPNRDALICLARSLHHRLPPRSPLVGSVPMLTSTYVILSVCLPVCPRTSFRNALQPFLFLSPSLSSAVRPSFVR